MRRIPALLALALLLASCGGEGTGPFSSTSAGATTAAPTSSTAATTTAAATTTTAPATHVWADRLVGTAIWGEWETGGEVRRLRGDGVGDEVMWIHPDICVPGPGAACSWRLVFASRPTTPPLALDAGYDGFIALAYVEPYSDSAEMEVLAAVDVALPPGAGIAAVLASREQGPYWPAELGFTTSGLTVLRAWSLDYEARTLTAVDPSAEDLPDVSGRADAGPVVGRVVTAQSAVAAPQDPNRTLDLSGAVPVVLSGFRAAGGSVVGGGGLEWQETVPYEPPRVVWLERLLGWIYSGSALWRVADSVEFGPVPDAIPGYFCRHEASSSDAVALVIETGCYACPVASAEAYRVDRTAWELVAVPPDEVLCTCECE